MARLFSLLSLIFLLFISQLFTISTSLSTVSISQYSTNYTLICALRIPSQNQTSPSLDCKTFPTQIQLPITIPNDNSFSAISGGTGFLCALRSSIPSSDPTALRCWRFSHRGNGKRIYIGPRLDELQSGPTHLCGLIGGTRRTECWQWPGFNVPHSRNFSKIAVGGEFLCGLSESGNISCVGNDSEVVGREPAGNFSVIAAGFRHACGISMDGSLHCWGSMVGPAPSEEFDSLALGENRSCGIRIDGKVVCWGQNFRLPENLAPIEFISIEAKGSIFCGILSENYSLVCWGSEIFNTSSMVFESVMPGACRSSCGGCKILPGSSRFCVAGNICERCALRQGANPPAWPPTSPPTSPESGRRSSQNLAFLIVGCVGSGIGLATILGFLLFRYCTGRGCRVHDSGRLDDEVTPTPDLLNSRREARIERVGSIQILDKRLRSFLSVGRASSHLKEFTLDVLLQITNNFSEDHKIGSGSFGSVYQATLEDGREVAIKRADLPPSPSHTGGGITRRNEKESAFIAELALLSRVNHKNLVQLLGFCEEQNEFVLVYEFMPNGTLHEHLHKLEGSPLMSWVPRLKVALDAARGIEYLHTYAVPPIIHRDIKSSNILLDSTWTAKVSDFGLSLMGPVEGMAHLSLTAAGTVGYMDPEYYRLQQLTTKSDVYSFGVLLLELLSGYRAIHPQEEDGLPRNVVDFVKPHIIADEIHLVLDRRLPPPTPYEIEAVTYVGYLAADCVNLEGRDRPSMTEVVNSLEKALTVCLAPMSLSRSPSESST
ncbi:CRINKLY4 related 4 [Tasmannia lanceolata]|uniref:CRINKLY4 related 4 n=1 Tax=Tasmannia lanceolata TaxID=3420 RepID=UPI00406329DF